jgi:hypothetical protein
MFAEIDGLCDFGFGPGLAGFEGQFPEWLNVFLCRSAKVRHARFRATIVERPAGQRCG